MSRRLKIQSHGRTTDGLVGLTGYRPLFGTSDCWPNFRIQFHVVQIDNLHQKNYYWQYFFDPIQPFFYLSEPLDFPNPYKMPKVNVKTEVLRRKFWVKYLST